jgi:Mor family transcriptional regulator
MTDSAVIEARSRYAAGDTLKTLCAVYKISPSAMFSIVQGLAWTHIGGPIAPPPRIMGRVPKERIPEVLETYEAGVSAMNIGKKFGVSSTAIRSIILKHTKEGMRPVIKLTIQDVIDIRRACHTGQSVAALAKHYAVTEENVSMIVRGKTWAHVDAGVPLAPTNTHGRRTLTDKQAILIRQRYDAGEGSTSIARDFPVTRTAINLIGQRRTYNNG